MQDFVKENMKKKAYFHVGLNAKTFFKENMENQAYFYVNTKTRNHVAMDTKKLKQVGLCSVKYQIK